jgi:RimJ/RimL family protein N-acetyltransferase
MMAHYKKLVGNLCYLSPVTPTDGELWAEWLNDLEVALPLGDEAFQMITSETALGWAEQATKNQEAVFTIVKKDNEQAIGRCLLFGINHTDRTAMCGLLIGEKSLWGKGCGSEALALLLDYGFNLLNLNSIMLGVYSFNQRAILLYRKLGFREIGRRRQARIIAGKAYDVILMDLLANEFSSPLVKNMLGLK